MKFFYPSIIVVLFLLSIFDLIVGLINDAVNFLNSAIGSQVSSRRTIMIFASLGILLGAFLSSGMMEVARKGVFDPSYFYFSDIIFIFLAVMISDILLLDIFNTLGLPTSTTVSMVFCLLGGAFSIAMIKMSSPLNNEPFHHLTLYIKAEKTLNISIGIFLSIIISFTSGAFIHYFIRYLFSFEYESKLKYAGVIWAAISLSGMTYFLIVKGLHSTLQGFINDNYLTGFSLFIQHLIKWIHHNFFIFLLILFLTWTIVAKIFVSLGYNILKFVVLYGTFSLAMAFAGNDLVNFIGIPIAGIQSYNIWKEAGSPPAEKFNMKSLSGNVQVPSLVLIFAGMIMILTLWFSKKTKNITSTEINLSRQNEGPEKFLSNSFSRGIVRFFLCFGNSFFKFFPKRLLVRIEKNFKQKKTQKKEIVAFDLVRASANLTISSILISIATVQKLPLSTTFVTFMVSMGTSLSDRAWDRESAVYRVSGVLKVIRGWFLTGLIAFTMAGVTAAFLYFFKAWALYSLIFLIVFVFYKSYKNYHKKIKEEKPLFDIIVNMTLETTLNKTFDILNPILEYIEVIYKNSIEGITQENLKTLQFSRNSFLKVKENFTNIQNSLTQVIRKTKKSEPIAGIFYLQIYNKTKEIIESSDMITNHTLFHVINSHKPLKYQQKKNLLTLEDLMIEHFNIIKKITIDRNCKKIQLPCPIQNKILKKIEEQMNQQVMGIIYKKYGTKNTFLMLDILLQSKKITESVEDIILLYKNNLSHISSKKDASFLAF
ncbi:inorganic phosphate transporter [Blattabacterium cuenoti]|uniref:inorganic phosphate transporter n=1 Tax=Blattabacterium cuenoti TaxID=1653831 RepID=UPI00163C2F0F|nr:inorganic phosphate transporter [Blattabacterium cuenoti]